MLMIGGFCRMEVILLLAVVLAYGYNDGGAIGYILLSISSWFMGLSWLFAPYVFNPSGFEWQKSVLLAFFLWSVLITMQLVLIHGVYTVTCVHRTVEDFRDWTNWLFYRGGIGVKGEESWEAWWDEELVCISMQRIISYFAQLFICQ
jgi:callose synthase